MSTATLASSPLSPSVSPAVAPVVADLPAAVAGVSNPGVEVKKFYDTVGWTIGSQGVAEDTHLFGVHEDGPIRRSMHAARIERIRAALTPDDGRKISLLECGCGGNPAAALMDLCRSYTGVDFSTTGLKLAEQRTRGMDLDHRFVQADIRALPFADDSFDAVYSAHAIYHIPSAEGQRRALSEAMRVLKPGGRAVFVLSNPRPLLFPVRLARRLIADTPILGAAIDRLRRQPPLPYKAMPLGWMRRRLQPYGRVRIIGYALASVWFDQHVSEQRGWGRSLWKRFERLETNHPTLSAHLGNFVTIIVQKHEQIT